MIKYVCLLCICCLKFLCALIVACAGGGASGVLVWTDAKDVIRGGGGGSFDMFTKTITFFSPKKLT